MGRTTVGRDEPGLTNCRHAPKWRLRLLWRGATLAESRFADRLKLWGRKTVKNEGRRVFGSCRNTGCYVIRETFYAGIDLGRVMPRFYMRD